MKSIKKELLLYAVTDSSWTSNFPLETQVEQAILGGATIIQLREKNLSDDAFIKKAWKIKEVTSKYNIPFIINDNISVARVVDADGVHIGQSDDDLIEARRVLGDNKIIGVSVQNENQAMLAVANSADYLGVGAVFPTNTKSDADYVSLEQLEMICSNVNIPVVAIGGIGIDNIAFLRSCGISGVALVSAIFAAKDIKSTTKALLEETINSIGECL